MRSFVWETKPSTVQALVDFWGKLSEPLSSITGVHITGALGAKKKKERKRMMM